ncbi:hypothetical protein GCM10008994_21300 [Halorubrum ejinorense]|uniref:Uncharacterized protein n=1 Tax=Halorubrum ejinorense TaxID=425309 RepID=A0AAV3SSS8_9EURY
MRRAGRKPDAVEQSFGVLASLSLRDAQFDEWQRDVRPRRQRRKQVEPLKDDADVLETKPGSLPSREVGGVRTAHRHRTVGRDVERREEVEEG